MYQLVDLELKGMNVNVNENGINNNMGMGIRRNMETSHTSQQLQPQPHRLVA